MIGEAIEVTGEPADMDGLVQAVTERFGVWPSNIEAHLIDRRKPVAASDAKPPTYESLYSGEYHHPWALTG